MARANLAVLLAVALLLASAGESVSSRASSPSQERRSGPLTSPVRAVVAADAERCTSCNAVMSSLRGMLGAQDADPALVRPQLILDVRRSAEACERAVGVLRDASAQVDLAQRTLCGKHAGVRCSPTCCCCFAGCHPAEAHQGRPCSN